MRNTFNLEQALYDAESVLNPLHRESLVKYQVNGVQDGYVVLSVALPQGMPAVFVSMLESLVTLFRGIDRKGRHCDLDAKVHNLEEIEKERQFRENFEEAVFSCFDDLISQGIMPKEAIKKTNHALKAQNHPWACYEVISSTLRASGRLRKNKGVIKT